MQYKQTNSKEPFKNQERDETEIHLPDIHSSFRCFQYFSFNLFDPFVRSFLLFLRQKEGSNWSHIHASLHTHTAR